MTRQIIRNSFEHEICFSDEELKWLWELAGCRQQPKQHNNYATDKRIIRRDNTETHLIGLLGEYAGARLLHLPLDQNAYVQGDIIKDWTLFGITIECKTLQGYLTFKKLTDFVADIAVLFIYDRDDYHHVWTQGWITRKAFARTHFIDDFGYGSRPCMQPCDLLTIQTLRTYCLIAQQMRKMYRLLRTNTP